VVGHHHHHHRSHHYHGGSSSHSRGRSEYAVHGYGRR
jgi:hypothetical protein